MKLLVSTVRGSDMEKSLVLSPLNHLTIMLSAQSDLSSSPAHDTRTEVSVSWNKKIFRGQKYFLVFLCSIVTKHRSHGGMTPAKTLPVIQNINLLHDLIKMFTEKVFWMSLKVNFLFSVLYHQQESWQLKWQQRPGARSIQNRRRPSGNYY